MFKKCPFMVESFVTVGLFNYDYTLLTSIEEGNCVFELQSFL
jgi:hypothetical protein